MKVLGFIISTILIIISLSQISVISAQEQKIAPQQISPPPPSSKVGCYHWTKETGWEPVQCMSQADEEKLGLSGPPRSFTPSLEDDRNNSWTSLLVFGAVIGVASCTVSVFALRYKSA